MRSPTLVLLLLLTVATPGAPVAAQDAGPCADIEPRDAEFFRSLAGTPAAEAEDESGSQAAATPTPFAMPGGEPADEAVLAEVTTLYEQLVACLNAGDYLRVYALYSDDYLQRNLSEEILTTLQATPAPAEASTQSEFGGVLDARVLDGDRIAALLTTRNPQSGEVLIFAILRRDGVRLLIDEEQVVEAEGSAATPMATPAA